MMNHAVYQTVHRTGDGALYVAVYRAGGDAVAWAVHGAVSWASSQGVDGAGAQPEEPLHPGLGIYLGGVPG